MLLTNLEGHNKTSLKHDTPLIFLAKSFTIRLMLNLHPRIFSSTTSKGIEADESWELRPMALRRGAGYTNQTPMAVTGGCFRRGSVYKYYPFGGESKNSGISLIIILHSLGWEYNEQFLVTDISVVFCWIVQVLVMNLSLKLGWVS